MQLANLYAAETRSPCGGPTALVVGFEAPPHAAASSTTPAPAEAQIMKWDARLRVGVGVLICIGTAFCD
jgi:hypothetical protein